MNKQELIPVILKTVSLVMGIAALVLSVFNIIGRITTAIMLIIALICISIYTYLNEKNEEKEKEEKK